MSALNSGPDTVICRTQIVVRQDRTGSNVLGPGPEKEYRGVSVQPAGLSAFGKDEVNNVVDADYILMKSITPSWIGGPHSIIEWNGELYDQVGIVKRFMRGRRTKHEVVKLKARGTAVK